MKRFVILFLYLLAVPSAYAAEYKCVSVQPVVDTSIYASGDLIGGKLTFTNIVSGSYDQTLMLSATVYDEAAQASDLDLVIFSANPTLTTFTDQAALDVADADLVKVATVFNFGSTSRFVFADNSVHVVQNQGVPLKVTGNTSNPRTYYGALVSRGTPTFAASTDIVVKLCVQNSN